jgi:hypothetical protein
LRNEKILFTPELELDPGQAPRDVTVKGQSPRLDYPFTLKDLYPVVPALDARSAYQKIQEELDRLDDFLFHKLKLRRSFRLPSASDDTQALYLLGILFDPTSYYTDGLWWRLDVLPVSAPTDFLRLDEARPFPLRLASPQKLIHTLVWIDTNIKVIVESITEPYKIPVSAVRQIVESALKIYSYLVKQRDYQLARSINFNYSMFLQDRILNLIFGDGIYLAAGRLQEQGKLANHIALQLLKKLSGLSYRQLCTLSVFMGVIWTSRKDVQQAFLTNPSATLANIDTQLNTQRTNWCIDHIDQFLSDMGADSQETVVVVLDDNGESVFDVALFQRLLNDTGMLQVTFVVNRYPISNNIAMGTFQALLEDAYFADLRRHFDQDRATLCIERQVLRSFELIHLQPNTLHAIKNSQATYIKGGNFFETFQIPEIVRYHCFTVYGRTSMLLTGCTEGRGVFVKLQPGQTGYTYYSYDQIETLRDEVARGEVENHALQSSVGN